LVAPRREVFFQTPEYVFAFIVAPSYKAVGRAAGDKRGGEGGFLFRLEFSNDFTNPLRDVPEPSSRFRQREMGFAFLGNA